MHTAIIAKGIAVEVGATGIVDKVVSVVIQKHVD